jgi:hypothetical protein
MSEKPEPAWWEDDAAVDAFAEKHRGRLIEKLGLSDLFTEPTPGKPGKPPTKEGGGQQVRSQEAEGAMSSLVAALTKGVELGASFGAAKAAGEKAPPPPKPKRKSWFFGDVDDA